MKIQIIATETAYDVNGADDSCFTSFLVGIINSTDKITDLIKVNALQVFDDSYVAEEDDADELKEFFASKRQDLVDNLSDLDVSNGIKNINDKSLTELTWFEIYSSDVTTDEIKYFAMIID